jgi:hypothetical protein
MDEKLKELESKLRDMDPGSTCSWSWQRSMSPETTHNG